ncbi:ribosome recycling factor [Iamia sp.]|uniref:ribosome recycling factor n=1 Tax=Iamia sp. TaxID=2722710 RepID=UPI002CF6CF74|nr:ribosome recycling factor [Iamia sp.]HXH56684.1 ribosome recycling factor [Iamia sp.]
MSDELVTMVLEDTRDKMTKAVSHARHEFASIRTGRASPALVEKLMVEYYGSEVPLQQMANISVPEARQLVISPYDKGSVPAVEKAIRSSELGLNPSNDGNLIRLSFPPLTGDRRRDLVRIVKKMAEDNRVSVRNARRTARSELESLEKDGDLSKDDLVRAEKEIDALTHSTEAQIDDALSQKETELLED